MCLGDGDGTETRGWLVYIERTFAPEGVRKRQPEPEPEPPRHSPFKLGKHADPSVNILFWTHVVHPGSRRARPMNAGQPGRPGIAKLDDF